MRCHICNSELASPSFNRDHGDINPCGTCQEVINNVFTDTVAEEEQLEVEPTAEEMMEVVEDLQYGRLDVV